VDFTSLLSENLFQLNDVFRFGPGGMQILIVALLHRPGSFSTAFYLSIGRFEDAPRKTGSGSQHRSTWPTVEQHRHG
jgi:hypothetical protein